MPCIYRSSGNVWRLVNHNRLQAKQGMGFIIAAINNFFLIEKKMLH
ncbi:hypothetical protein EMIT0194P_110098 [Pseudomonas serbica]